MSDINLNDTKGYYRDLVKMNFDEFCRAIDRLELDSKDSVADFYRVCVNLALILNHQADKVAILDASTPSKKAYDLIIRIKAKYPDEGEQLDFIRRFANDVKHSAKLEQYATTVSGSITGVDDKSICSWLLGDQNGQTSDLVGALITSYVFWGKYFADERQL